MKLFFRRIGGILGTLRAEYRQIMNRYFGTIEHFEGDATAVCEQIIDKLWEGDFYRTSLGHFDFFWMRDFGTVAEPLMKLGYSERVHHTLQWALRYYQRAGDITTCIDKAGNTFNAPAHKSIDALPWLLHSLVVSDYQLSLAERAFLQRQLEKYNKTFLDPTTGDIIKAHYAEMRDAVYYDRSAYSVALVARMAHCVPKLGLTTFPFHTAHYQTDLRENYWTGNYFKADRRSDAYSSECALMPFFLHIIDDADMMNATFDYITAHGYSSLSPLQYCPDSTDFHFRLGMGKIIMPNYTGTSIWTWHATFYLHLLRRQNRPEYAAEYAKFSALIERHGNYPELLNADGSWYNAPFYRSDPGMVWAALFLELPQPLMQ
jgi:hypothetical protein